MATQTASSSSSSSWKYDVFLSFCGVDTRKNFIGHLYTALEQKGILTFKDDEKLERGKYISLELLKAIEESKYAIIILSTNYAFSRWCLTELVKIVECVKETKLTVLPVFYHVDPSDVRNQMGTLAQAFEKHEKDPKINKDDIQAWKAALKEVGNISGWHLHDRDESKIIQQIFERIFNDLNSKFSSTVSKDLVAIDSRVNEMLDLYLDEELGGVRFVGICGMGGMGKTTLAQKIYQRISSSFEASSFIANVREETRNQHLVCLQKQLLSKILIGSKINIWDFHEGINVLGNRLRNKKVLIVLDDVDKEEQLEALAGNHDWFGLGSRIIVTSRDSHLLRRCGVNDIYTVKGLNNDDALQLFSWRAFKKPYPEENYVDLSKDIVNYAKGLPLALKVLGSLLFEKTTNEWKSAIYKLKAELNKKILDILQISFDGLMDTQKELFLDIACFFKGENKYCIRDILISFGYYPDYNLGVLMDRSLITIDENGTLWMHDLLQELGQEIVRRESPKVPSGRSRLWLYEDVLHILKNNTGTEVVEGIVLNTPNQKEEHLNSKAFSKMKKLRLLKINNVEPPNGLLRGNVQLPQGLSHLSDELRVIEWHGYPLNSLPTSFQSNKLVELKMHCSLIKQLWKGIMNLDELKLIDLSDSQTLIEIPDLSGAPNLKKLILQRCTRLHKIHASLGNLKWLIQLDLNGCKCLESLPHKINLEALEILDLGGCSRLNKFPEIVGNMPHLSKLNLSETAIKDLSFLVEHSIGHIKLDLGHGKNLSSLPDSTCSLSSLKTLTLSGCSKLHELPENLGNIKGLKELDVSRTAIRRLPSSIVLLKNLRKLSLSSCEGLSSKSSNKLLSFPLMQPRRIPYSMGMLVRTLSGIQSLTELDLSYCNIRAIPYDISCLSALRELNLRGNNFDCLPESIIQLSNLRYLFLSGCTNLRLLPELPLNIKYIDAEGCISLETLPARPEDNFPYLRLLNCVKLINNESYDNLFLTMLRHDFFKRPDYDRICVLIPGNNIPKWFSHQSEVASLNLQGPSDFLGIAVCVVYVLRQHPSEFSKLYRWIICHFYFKEMKEYEYGHFGGKGNGFSEEFGKIDSYHLWLTYFPIKYFEGKSGKKLVQSDADVSQIELRFESEGPGLEVVKYGAHLVYTEDLNQTMAVCSNCNITPYEADFEDSVKVTKMKRSSDNYDGDDARPSGEGIPSDVYVPHPKRIKLPNLIERFIPCLGNLIGNSSTQVKGDSDCNEEESSEIGSFHE